VVAHSGNACGSVPLVLADAVGSSGAVRVFDANLRALEETLTANPEAARIVQAQRTCLSVPVQLSSDRVWGKAPPCLQGYVGRLCDGLLFPTPATTVWPWREIADRDLARDAAQGPSTPQLVLVSLEPEELAGFMDGAPLPMMLGGCGHPPFLHILGFNTRVFARSTSCKNIWHLKSVR